MKILIPVVVLIALAVAQYPNQFPNNNNVNSQLPNYGNYPGSYTGNYPSSYNGNYPSSYNGNYPGSNNGNYPGSYTGNYPGGYQQFGGYQQPGFYQQPGAFQFQQPGGGFQQYGGYQQPFRQTGGFQQFYYPFAQSNFPLINSYFWRQCALESRTPEDELNRFRNRDFSNQNANQNANQNIQCFTHCILEKMGLIQNGEILDQRVLQILSQSYPLDQISSRIATCRQQSRGFNRCESSYRFYICVLNSANNQDVFRFQEIR